MDALQVLEYNKAEDINNYLEPMDTLDGILSAFRDVLISIEASQHFNYIPKTKIDGFDFYNEWIEKIERAIHKFTLRNEDLKEKLLLILKEIEIFIRTYETPGVVKRWRDINPMIHYFDVAYTFMNEEPELYERIKNGDQKIKFSIYPSEKDLVERNAYFKKIEDYNNKNNLRYSDLRIFSNELDNTLNKVINHDLKEYLNQ